MIIISRLGVQALNVSIKDVFSKFILKLGVVVLIELFACFRAIGILTLLILIAEKFGILVVKQKRVTIFGLLPIVWGIGSFVINYIHICNLLLRMVIIRLLFDEFLLVFYRSCDQTGMSLEIRISTGSNFILWV